MDDLAAKYADIDVDPSYLRLYPDHGAISRMCASFHERLNRHFDFMNYKSGTNRHFNANDSRDLIALIDEIDDAQQILGNVGIVLSVREDYAQVISRCRRFLVEAYGSPIPDDFERIRLVKYEPVLILPDTRIRAASRQQSYELQMVGEGAFAFVYRYYDPEYDIPFALKRAKRDLGEKELLRFRREFDLMHELRFPYVLDVYRYNEERHEYTMEYCDATLNDYILRFNTTLSFVTRKRIALQFLYGLNYLHTNGHLHRDISFRNILVKQYDGSAVIVKLSDFGLAKRRGSDLTSSESELRGTIIDPTIGSFKDYGVRNEVYSIGFILSFIFSGRKDIAACSGATRRVIDKCVSYDLPARYSDVLSIVRDIEGLEPEPTSTNETPA
ncbi:MAG: protein kinase family protein [Acidimicrobiia bacterium]